MTDLLGRVFVVTGASSGVGRATARALARRGATVALVARTEATLRDAAREFAALSPDARAIVVPADLSTVPGAVRAAQRLREEIGEIDVLVNNVGAVFPTRAVTADGLERTFALNHLGVFVLTRALLPALRGSDRPRVVTVSSQVHADQLDVRDLQLERRYGGLRAYRQSKLLNLLFNAELHRREGYWLFTAALHPGVVDTPLLKSYDQAGELERDEERARVDASRGLAHRAATTVARALSRSTGLYRTIGVSPDEGARTTLHVATSDDALAQPGAYWREARVASPHPVADDASLAAEVWRISERLAKENGA